MTRKLCRREFVSGSAAGLLAATIPSNLRAAPAVVERGSVNPVVIAAPNGFYYKNGGNVTCIEKAFSMMTGGSDVLDALIAGVNLVELDPEEDSVGYGGLPNADGVVQLDSCCMHGPKKQAGGVAALEGVRTPSLVARAVMAQTDHHLLVGQGAQSFARNMGFKIEDDLNTEHSRKAWLEWKRRIDPKHYIDPAKRSAVQHRVIQEMARDGYLSSTRIHGTINCDGINANGDICGVTTTSGLAWKIPGRVGDSPILGAGLYVDNAVGAAGSTGRGEANLFNLTSFLIVENLRHGMHPKDAGMEALKRVRANTVEKRLCKKNGDPNFQIAYYVLNIRGEHAGVAMYSDDEGNKGWAGIKDNHERYCFCDHNGPQTAFCDALIEGQGQE